MSQPLAQASFRRHPWYQAWLQEAACQACHVLQTRPMTLNPHQCRTLTGVILAHVAQSKPLFSVPGTGMFSHHVWHGASRW